MPEALIPADEQQRLDALNELGILYTPLADRLDRITRTLCGIFNVPFAHISLMDSDTQWFKSTQGFEIINTERKQSLCSHTLLAEEYLVCEDLAEDERFRDLVSVTQEPKFRFYASFVLKSRGQNIGTLCIEDLKPRSFSQDEIASMRDITSWAQTEIHLTQLSEVQVQLITELDQAQQKAKLDGLTGLWNQGAIKDILQRAHHRHLITQKPYTLMMVDIDNFKSINDTYGHPFGDQVISAIAQELKASLRPSDAVGRYGGDEFLIILENCPHPRAEELGQRILHHSRQLTMINKGGKVNFTISMGIASTDYLDVNNHQTLLEHADQSLYQAKESGRNCARG
jgi:diguanylate cyclase (GGDEF)-like protein